MKYIFLKLVCCYSRNVSDKIACRDRIKGPSRIREELTLKPHSLTPVQNLRFEYGIPKVQNPPESRLMTGLRAH